MIRRFGAVRSSRTLQLSMNLSRCASVLTVLAVLCAPTLAMPPAFSTVVLSGRAAPGTNHLVFTEVAVPFISNAGSATFFGRVNSPDPAAERGVWLHEFGTVQ